VQQVLRNLLANAIKYGTAAGPGGEGLDVVAEVQPASGGQLLVSIEVLDRGPGLGGDRPAPAAEPHYGPSAGLGLSCNLFNGNRLNSQIKQVRFQTENSKLLLEDARVELNAQISSRCF
jgi:K+-sensing histidine kinase KdpD